MPPSSPASSTPAAPSSARRIANISASPAAATPARPAPSIIRTRWAIRPAARRPAARVVVATGEADMAIGGDQGGSIRIPSSFSGIYGMKGTHGLVPYTGVMPIELTLDHTGPMTRNVRDNALLLEVLAGADGLDPRQVCAQGRELHRSARRRRQGIAHRRRQGRLRTSGLRAPTSMPRSWRAHSCSEKLGATVDEISVPMHLLAPAIWLPIAAEGATEFMMKGNGMGTNWRGLYNTTLLGRPFRLAPSRRRIVRQSQDHDAARSIFHQALSRPFLCQGAEPEPQAARRLRCGARQLRSAADADLADEGDAAAAAGCAARTLYPARIRNGAQYRAVQRHRASGDDAFPAA